MITSLTTSTVQMVLESINNVIKTEVTIIQLIPIMSFLIKVLSWVGEQSTRRDINDVNYIEFALEHSFTTLDWRKGHAWRSDNNMTKCRHLFDLVAFSFSLVVLLFLKGFNSFEKAVFPCLKFSFRIHVLKIQINWRTSAYFHIVLRPFKKF